MARRTHQPPPTRAGAHESRPAGRGQPAAPDGDRRATLVPRAAEGLPAADAYATEQQLSARGADRAIQGPAPLPVIAIDDRGAIVLVNEAWVDLARALGLGAGATDVGADFARILRAFPFAEADADRLVADLNALLGDERRQFGRALSLATPVRRTLMLRGTPLHSAAGGATIAFLDTTDRHAHTAALRRTVAVLRVNEARYRRRLDTANEGIWITGADHRVAYVNQRLASMLGYAAADLIGGSILRQRWSATASRRCGGSSRIRPI